MTINSRNTAAGLSIAAAFMISVAGDWFFENQWSNPYWYLFELIVWSAGFAVFFMLYQSDDEAPASDDDGQPE